MGIMMPRTQAPPDRPRRDGLTTAEVLRKRALAGSNALAVSKPRSPWLILLAQFKSLIVGLLAVAVMIAIAFGSWVEAIAITAVILINTLIGFFTEWRATKSMEALRQLTCVHVTVRRDGRVQRLPAAQLVPDDIVLVEGGDIVAADMRLLESSRLQADESSLTGESVPVGKHAVENDQDDVRSGTLFSGTSVTRGSGEGIVTATGLASELGKISALVKETDDEITPLERRLEHLGYRLVWVTLAVALLTFAIGAATGKSLFLMLETSIALACSVWPIEMP